MGDIRREFDFELAKLECDVRCSGNRQLMTGDADYILMVGVLRLYRFSSCYFNGINFRGYKLSRVQTFANAKYRN